MYDVGDRVIWRRSNKEEYPCTIFANKYECSSFQYTIVFDKEYSFTHDGGRFIPNPKVLPLRFAGEYELKPLYEEDGGTWI